MHMKNYEINIRGNAEYCGETCEMYFKKHHVYYCLHPESCILHLTKGKLWFAWFCNSWFYYNLKESD